MGKKYENKMMQTETIPNTSVTPVQTQKYVFTDLQIVIEATSREEAEKKLSEIIKSNK